MFHIWYNGTELSFVYLWRKNIRLETFLVLPKNNV